MEDKILQKWMNSLGEARSKIVRIILFGSRARGDARPDSDYDLLLIVTKRDREILDRCYDGVMDVLLATGRLISLKIFTAEEFSRLQALPTPFMSRIQAEGVNLG